MDICPLGLYYSGSRSKCQGSEHFEATALIAVAGFVEELSRVLETDVEHSILVEPDYFNKLGCGKINVPHSRSSEIQATGICLFTERTHCRFLSAVNLKTCRLKATLKN